MSSLEAGTEWYYPETTQCFNRTTAVSPAFTLNIPFLQLNLCPTLELTPNVQKVTFGVSLELAVFSHVASCIIYQTEVYQ